MITVDRFREAHGELEAEYGTQKYEQRRWDEELKRFVLEPGIMDDGTLARGQQGAEL